jgi:HNH endonuclease
MPTRMMKDLFTGEIKFIDENDIPGRFGISFNKLRELLEVNVEEGWAKRKFDSWFGNTLAAKAGDLLPWHTKINGIDLLLYHIIWVFARNGKWAENEIDHKDGNDRNNKIFNLRDGTQSQNLMNQKMRSNNTSGVTGVYWNEKKQRWGAYITSKEHGKRKNLGHFADFEKACQVRWDAEDQYHGEFARRHSRPRLPIKDLFSV